MYPFLKQHRIFNEVIIIDTKKTTPQDVISNFFGNFKLVECRQNLWNLFETAVVAEHDNYSEPEARAELLHFYQSLEELLEAIFLINEKITTEK